MNDFIQAQSISFSYHVEEGQAPVNVFENLSVDIHQGEMTAVLGHNGSGKSTFAKHLNAILLPSGGKVYVDGIDTADEERLYDIRQEVGMVFQNPDNQIVATVVEEDVAFGLENVGVPPKEIRERVDRALMDVGIYEYKKHAPHRLSGGQKQRVAIAGISALSLTSRRPCLTRAAAVRSWRPSRSSTANTASRLSSSPTIWTRPRSATGSS